MDGPYTLQFLRIAEESGLALLPITEIQNAHTTSAYRFTAFQGEPIVVLGTGSDSGVDSDGNSFFNLLDIRMDVLMREAGNSAWSARLVDQNSTELEVLAGNAEFTQGINTIGWNLMAERSVETASMAHTSSMTS